MGKKKKELEETQDMSMTFIAEVGQKSAVAEDKLDDVSGTIDIKKEPPTKEELNGFEANLNDNHHSNKGIMVVVILMLLCFIVGFGSSKLFFHEKAEKKQVENKKTDKIEKESTDTVISPESLFVKDLIARYHYPYLADYVYEILYSKEKIVVEDMEENYLQMLVAMQATKNPFVVDFSSEEFQDALTLLFGDQVVLDNKDISFDKYKCNKITFDEKLNTYHLESKENCEISNSFKIKNKVISVQKKEDTLEVDIAIAVVDENADKVYKKYDLENKKGEEELEDKKASDFDIFSDEEDFNQYKYIFHYDKNNHNYYLKQIEQME